MELSVLGGKEKLQVADKVFAADYRQALVHQIVTAYRAAGRSGSKAQKTRSDCRGGGKKMYRQKGTGRARAGSRNSPIRRGGGVTFAARPRSFKQKVNRKMYRGAMASILSELLRSERLVVVANLKTDGPKVADLRARFQDYAIPAEGLLVPSETSSELERASNNVVDVEVLPVQRLNPVALLRSRRVVMEADSIRFLERWLS